MKFLKEITSDWKTDYRVPCHTYMIENQKMLGYIKEGTDTPFVFSKPKTFEQRGRKFVEVSL